MIKVLSVILVLAVMLAGLPITITAGTAEEHPFYELYPSDDICPVVELGERRTVSVDEAYYCYRFIPSKTGWYDFSTDGISENKIEVYFSLSIYNADWEYINGRDCDYDDTFVFAHMTAGSTYYCLVYSDFYQEESYEVFVEKMPSAESITITAGYSIEDYVGNNRWLNVSYEPKNACVDLSWTSSDETVATVASNGMVRLVAPGTATITVTSASGLTDTCAVTVSEIKSLTLDTPVTIPANSKSCLSKFIPEETASYGFLSSVDSDCYADGWLELYDENMKVIEGESSDDKYFCRLDHDLTAGKVYYIKSYFCCYSDGIEANYQLKVIKTVLPTAIEIEPAGECDFYRGSSLTLVCVPTPEDALMKGIKWSLSSDSNAAEIDYSWGDRCYLSLNTPGEVTVTAQVGEMSDTYAFTVKEYDPISVGSVYTIPCSYDDTFRSFVPALDGAYRFTATFDAPEEEYLWPDGRIVLSDSQMSWLNSSWFGERACTLVYDLKAGETYCLSVYAMREGYDNYGLTVEKLPDLSELKISSSTGTQGYPFSDLRLECDVLPEGSFANVTWSSSDLSVATVESYGMSAYINLKSPGTAQITASALNGTVSDSVAITVLEPDPLTLSEALQVPANGSTNCNSFTPEEDGWYRFTVSPDSDDQNWFFTYYPVIRTNDLNGVETFSDDNSIDCWLRAGTAYYFFSGICNDESDHYSIIVEELIDATSVVIDQGDSIEGYAGFSSCLTCTLSPGNANGHEMVWSSSDDSVASVYDNGNSVQLYYHSAGTAKVTVTAAQGVTDVIDVTVLAPTVMTLDAVYTAAPSEAREQSYFSFTPEKDGYYDLVIFDDDDYDIGTSMYLYQQYYYADTSSDVSGDRIIRYYFDQGETYSFCSLRYTGTNAYRLMMRESLTADSIGFVSGGVLNGFVGETYYLDVETFPAFSLTDYLQVVNSNEDVVECWYYSNSKQLRCSLMAAGTATVTLSSESGLNAVCNITVYDADSCDEISLGETKTVSSYSNISDAYYRFTPAESGEYTFYSYGSDSAETYGAIYDGSFGFLNDDAGWNTQNPNLFSVSTWMKAGSTYILSTSPMKYKASEKPVTYKVAVKKKITPINGDADGDGNVGIMDATMIQRYLAMYSAKDPEWITLCGDVDGNGLSIMDATAIQRFLARYADPYQIGQPK